MPRKTFTTTKQKLRKLWEDNDRNTSLIKNNLNKKTLDFNSINYTKGITKITLLENTLYNSSEHQNITYRLENFPEWIINHINILSITSTTEGFDLSRNIVDLLDAFLNGTLSVGDTVFANQLSYWIVKLDGDNYDLKIFNSVTLIEITSVSEVGFTTQPTPAYIDLSLQILNPRNYENTNYIKQ